MRRYSKRTFSEDEVRNTIAHAEALRISDEIRKDGRLGSSSLDQVYEIARDLDIPRKYMNRSLRRNFPDQEEMLVQLEEMGAKPSEDLTFNMYKRYLLGSLQDNFPLESFEARGNSRFFIERRKLRLYGIDRIKSFRPQLKRKLASLTFGFRFPSEINIYSPVFTSACRETLERLNETFDLKFKIISHYDTYPEEI